MRSVALETKQIDFDGLWFGEKYEKHGYNNAIKDQEAKIKDELKRRGI